MVSDDFLYLLQFGCLIFSVLMALFLAVSRIHVSKVNALYERSRWILCGTMMILAVHYLLQMYYGFRASGDDVGALVNILFYSPVGFLISYSQIRIESGVKKRMHHLRAFLIAFAVIVAIFLVGWNTYHCLHMTYALYAMGGVFFFSMAYMVWMPARELTRFRRRVEAETGNEIETYHMFMRTGSVVVYLLMLTIPFIIFYRTSLFILGPLMLLALFVFIVSFVALGFNLSTVDEIVVIESECKSENSSLDSVIDQLSETDFSTISTGLEVWRREGGFRDTMLTLATLALRLGVERAHLSQYIAQTQGCTFRVWLSSLRMEEAKKLMLEHTDYTVEIIASECGFSSTSHFYRFFRNATGMTPREWRNSNDSP